MRLPKSAHFLNTWKNPRILAENLKKSELLGILGTNSCVLAIEDRWDVFENRWKSLWVLIFRSSRLRTLCTEIGLYVKLNLKKIVSF